MIPHYFSEWGERTESLRVGGGDRTKEKDFQNFYPQEYAECLEFKRDAIVMRLERADQGGTGVYISRKMCQRLTREHFADDMTERK